MEENKIIEENTLIFYDDEEGNIKIEVVYATENVWLTQNSMSKLFDVNTQDITKHIRNIYISAELNKDSTCSKMEQVQKEGDRMVKRNLLYYNLDMIISVGFRVNSKKATKFRTWANKIIKDYMVQRLVIK